MMQMKGIIKYVDFDRSAFFLVRGKKHYGFYLTKMLSKLFLEYLKPGVLVDFKYNDRKKYQLYQVEKFNRIQDLKTNFKVYDLKDLKKDMYEVVKNYENTLFIDFEMTMPARARNFRTEIIQVGYILTNSKFDELKKNAYYILPKSDSLSKRTVDFLKFDEEVFWKTAKQFSFFYSDLKKIIETFQPQIVVWGKNDIIVLSDAYNLHHVQPLTKKKQFTDLLTLHKNFYSLRDDLGLLNAYNMHCKKDISNQKHDALQDAKMTKEIYKSFLRELKK